MKLICRCQFSKKKLNDKPLCGESLARREKILQKSCFTSLSHGSLTSSGTATPKLFLLLFLELHLPPPAPFVLLLRLRRSAWGSPRLPGSPSELRCRSPRGRSSRLLSTAKKNCFLLKKIVDRSYRRSWNNSVTSLSRKDGDEAASFCGCWGRIPKDICNKDSLFINCRNYRKTKTWLA